MVTEARAFYYPDANVGTWGNVDIHVTNAVGTGSDESRTITLVLDIDGADLIVGAHCTQLLAPTSAVSATLPSGNTSSGNISTVR